MKTFAASMTVKPVLAAVLLTTSIACGSHGSPTQPSALAQQPAPTRPPATNTVAASKDGVPGVYRQDVVMSHTGTATVILRSPDADFSLQLYVTSGACAEITDLLSGACTIVGRTRPGDLPGIVRSQVTSGDRNTIWVLNSDPAPQSFTVGVELDA